MRLRPTLSKSLGWNLAFTQAVMALSEAGITIEEIAGNRGVILIDGLLTAVAPSD